MSTVEESLESLVEAVKNSQEYRDFLSAKQKIDEDVQLKQNLNKFRGENFKIQNNTGNEALYHGVDNMERDLAKFRENPIVDEFLTAELALCRMVQNINWKLIGALDFDVDFIED